MLKNSMSILMDRNNVSINYIFKSLKYTVEKKCFLELNNFHDDAVKPFIVRLPEL